MICKMQMKGNWVGKFGYFPLIFTQSYFQLSNILEKVFMTKHLEHERHRGIGGNWKKG